MRTNDEARGHNAVLIAASNTASGKVRRVAALYTPTDLASKKYPINQTSAFRISMTKMDESNM